jgi:hypothetical protein
VLYCQRSVSALCQEDHGFLLICYTRASLAQFYLICTHSAMLTGPETGLQDATLSSCAGDLYLGCLNFNAPRLPRAWNPRTWLCTPIFKSWCGFGGCLESWSSAHSSANQLHSSTTIKVPRRMLRARISKSKCHSMWENASAQWSSNPYSLRTCLLTFTPSNSHLITSRAKLKPHWESNQAYP